MINCKMCRNAGCWYCGEPNTVERCNGYIPTTNADKIRAMTDEELAEFLCKVNHECHECPADDLCADYGEHGMLIWLKREVADG